MNIKSLTEDFGVAGQILPEDMAALVAQGFKSVIVNRPDEEVEPELRYEVMEAAAHAAGLEIRYLPIIHGLAGMDEVHKTAAALKEMPAPIFAYCRSGARSETFYNAAQQLG